MRLANYLTILLATLLISGCSLFREKEVVSVTKPTKAPITIVGHPKPVSLTKVKFYVVSDKNIDEFLAKFKKTHGELVFVAVSVKGYENLSLNVAELRRYIDQQREIIVYYEDAVKADEAKDKEKAAAKPKDAK